MAVHDPNLDLPPTPILVMVVVLVLAAFGTVGMIIATGDAKPAAAAPQ